MGATPTPHSIHTSPPEAAHPHDLVRIDAEAATEADDVDDDDGDETAMLVVKAKESDRDVVVVEDGGGGGMGKQERREGSRSGEGEGEEEEEEGGGGIGEGRKEQLGKERRSMEQEKDGESRLPRSRRRRRSRFLVPIEWVKHLGKEVDPSFVLGVMVTYGVSQGFGGALYRISGNYFWKDTQLVQPSTAQMYSGIISSVWDWKPVWGLLTDLVPISGYHRRPYFLLSGLLSFFSLIVLLLEVKLQNGIAVMLLLLYTLGITIADVTIDAEIAKQSREKAGLATDFQTLCSISSTTGSFLGFLTSGFIVRIMGPKNALGLLSTSGALFLLLSCTLHEAKEHVSSLKATQVCRTMKRTCRSIFQTLGCPQVWKPILYMFISWAASPSIAEGKFYWYTDKERGLGFSEEFVGMSFALGSAGGFLGAVAYQNGLKNYSFRKIMLWAQVLVFVGGIVDLILVLRWNRGLHMPDSVFFLFDEIMIQTVGRLKWIPQLVLCAKLCPEGIEGTFFAILMAVDNVGLMTSMWGGALLQHSLGVKRDDFTNLWLAALIRTLLRLLPLFFLNLVPDALPSSPQLLPSDFTIFNLSDDSDNDHGCDDPGSDARQSPFADDQTVELIAHKS